MERLRKLREQAAAFSQSRAGERWVKVLRAAFVLGVVIWLAYQLSGIGWREVWASRPRSLWFYVIWLALYFQLPLIEVLIYRAVWGLPFRESLWPILRKRALNQDVVSYSGEAYFFVWARSRLALSGRKIAGTLKDNAIASALGSWAAAVLLVGGFLFSGQLVLTDLIGEQDPVYVMAGVALATVIGVLGMRFRKAVFTLAPRAVLGLLAAHFGRFVLMLYPLQILQWWVVLPEIPLEVWATMLAVITLINRMPLIPHKDLVGVGAVLGMTHLFPASAEAAIAAMLLVRSALDKALNALLFAAVALWERWRGDAVPVPKDAAADPLAAERESMLTEP